MVTLSFEPKKKKETESKIKYVPKESSSSSKDLERFHHHSSNSTYQQESFLPLSLRADEPDPRARSPGFLRVHSRD